VEKELGSTNLIPMIHIQETRIRNL